MWIAAVVLLWPGCTEPADGPTVGTAPGGFRSGPDAVVKVSGDRQRGRAGRALSDPLVVRVIDEVGNPVAGVRVVWSTEEDEASVARDTTETDPGGITETHLTLGPRLWRYTAQASPAGNRSFDLRTFFEATATVLPVRIEEFRFRAPEGGAEAVVGTGDTIEWENTDTIAHAVRAHRDPGGEVRFGSGRLEPGETFRFVSGESGRWPYTCPIHPDRSSGGTLVVR